MTLPRLFPSPVDARRRTLLGGCASLPLGTLLTACGGTLDKVKVATFNSPVQLPDAAIMPTTKQLEMGDRRVRVVVFQPDDNASARGHNLPQIAVRELESQLGRTCEIVDRSLANALDKELKLAEMSTSKGYLGPDVADFAVKLVMGVASWGAAYSQGSSYVDKKTGRTMITSRPGWTYQGRSKMTVRVYEIPSLRLVESIELEGNAQLSEQPYDLRQQAAPGLTQAATQKAVEAKSEELRNEFTPRGYITAARSNGKESIFKITMGKRAGVKPGNPVEIYTLRAGEVDLRTKKPSVEEVLIVKGKVSEQIGDSDAWITVDDAKAGAQIRRGDIVKVNFGTGFWDKARDRLTGS
jgi:hypothetical protein